LGYLQPLVTEEEMQVVRDAPVINDGTNLVDTGGSYAESKVRVYLKTSPEEYVKIKVNKLRTVRNLKQQINNLKKIYWLPRLRKLSSKDVLQIGDQVHSGYEGLSNLITNGIVVSFGKLKPLVKPGAMRTKDAPPVINDETNLVDTGGSYGESLVSVYLKIPPEEYVKMKVNKLRTVLDLKQQINKLTKTYRLDIPELSSEHVLRIGQLVHSDSEALHNLITDKIVVSFGKLKPLERRQKRPTFKDQLDSAGKITLA